MVWNKKIQQEIRGNRLKGGLILSFTVFLSLSFFSYNPQDPSLNSFGLSLKVTNYCGFIGAILADLFFQLFGLSSWFLILAGGLLSYKLLANRLQESLLHSSLLFSSFLLSFSSLSQLHFPEVYVFHDELSLGGGLGKFIVSSLTPLFHVTGTAVLLWSALALVFIFYSHALFSLSLLSFPKKFLILSVSLLKKIINVTGFIFHKIKPILFSFKRISYFLKKQLLSVWDFIFKNRKSLPWTEQYSPQTTPSPSLEQPMNENQQPRFTFKEKVSLNEENPLNFPEIKTSVQKQDKNSSFKKEGSIDSSLQEERALSIKKERLFTSTKLPSLDYFIRRPFIC